MPSPGEGPLPPPRVSAHGSEIRFLPLRDARDSRHLHRRLGDWLRRGGRERRDLDDDRWRRGHALRGGRGVRRPRSCTDDACEKGSRTQRRTPSISPIPPRGIVRSSSARMARRSARRTTPICPTTTRTAPSTRAPAGSVRTRRRTTGRPASSATRAAAAAKACASSSAPRPSPPAPTIATPAPTTRATSPPGSASTAPSTASRRRVRRTSSTASATSASRVSIRRSWTTPSSR